MTEVESKLRTLRQMLMDKTSQEAFKMTYFDLLKQHQYFNTFLQHNNEYYRKKFDDKGREPNYKCLICRYYGLAPNGSGNPNPSAGANMSKLVANNNNISDIWEALKQFGYAKRGSQGVKFKEFDESIQKCADVIVRLANHRMDSISPGQVPPNLFEDLKLLYDELKVVPSGKPKLVYVSKTMFFLLPDLVMPVDNAIVLRFLRSELPRGKKEFDLFKEIFKKYVQLAHHIGLKQHNGDGNWWNWSVPKRIDNAMIGFREIFNNDTIERIICQNMGTLLSHLSISPSSGPIAIKTAASSPRGIGSSVNDKRLQHRYPGQPLSGAPLSSEEDAEKMRASKQKPMTTQSTHSEHYPEMAEDVVRNGHVRQPFSKSALYEAIRSRYQNQNINKDSVLPSDWAANTESACEKIDGAEKQKPFLFCTNNKSSPKNKWQYRLYNPGSDGEWRFSKRAGDMVKWPKA